MPIQNGHHKVSLYSEEQIYSMMVLIFIVKIKHVLSYVELQCILKAKQVLKCSPKSELNSDISNHPLFYHSIYICEPKGNFKLIN